MSKTTVPDFTSLNQRSAEARIIGQAAARAESTALTLEKQADSAESRVRQLNAGLARVRTPHEAYRRDAQYQRGQALRAEKAAIEELARLEAQVAAAGADADAAQTPRAWADAQTRVLQFELRAAKVQGNLDYARAELAYLEAMGDLRLLAMQQFEIEIPAAAAAAVEAREQADRARAQADALQEQARQIQTEIESAEIAMVERLAGGSQPRAVA